MKENLPIKSFQLAKDGIAKMGPTTSWFSKPVSREKKIKRKQREKGRKTSPHPYRPTSQFGRAATSKWLADTCFSGPARKGRQKSHLPIQVQTQMLLR